jgi:UDPglucose 6-dehydrogenase
MRVSFMNELARLCHVTGADIHAVRLGVGSDSRIGKRFLYAGPGYGGSCFPKDVQALFHLGRAHGVPMRVAEATHVANEEQSHFLADLVEKAMGSVRDRAVAFWGLAFKPETDDIRESPSLKLAAALLAKGARIVGHDPEAGRNFAKAMAAHGDRVKVVDRDYDALDGAHALVLLTEWRSYRAPNFGEIRRRLHDADGAPPIVVDARNVWRPGEVARAGLRYRGIGVPSPEAAKTH